MTDRMFWLIFTAFMLALIVVLLKGCCVANCETMLAECERGLEEISAELMEIEIRNGECK